MQKMFTGLYGCDWWIFLDFPRLTWKYKEVQGLVSYRMVMDRLSWRKETAPASGVCTGAGVGHWTKPTEGHCTAVQAVPLLCWPCAAVTEAWGVCTFCLRYTPAVSHLMG